MAGEKIILGYGIFAIDGVNVALTRGGGEFNVEREYRPIEADGDRGEVKGRITKDTSKAMLKMNMLKLIPADMGDYYPALTVTDNTTLITVTGANDIADSDYKTVTWTGKTNDGKAVKITLDNAINLENFAWALADKDEVVQELNYTATYLETARDTEPWKIEFTK